MLVLVQLRMRHFVQFLTLDTSPVQYATLTNGFSHVPPDKPALTADAENVHPNIP